MNRYPPPPEALRRRGLLRVETNKAQGQELVLPPNAISDAFGKALFERIHAQQQANQEKTSCES